MAVISQGININRGCTKCPPVIWLPQCQECLDEAKEELVVRVLEGLCK